MVCTEQEAGAKWCPQARNAAPVDSKFAGTAGNLWESDTRTRCIGSRCMMWVWVDGTTKGVWDNEWTQKEVSIPPEERRGTCGLINRSA